MCTPVLHHHLVDLHDDGNFATVAGYLPDLRERTIWDTRPRYNPMLATLRFRG
jgi:hypothetical protein